MFSNPESTENLGNDVGPAIRQARLATGMSARMLAERLQVSVGTISAIENGKTSVSTRRLRDLADAFGIEASALLEPARPRANSAFNDGEPENPSDTGNWRELRELNLDSVLSAAIDSFVDTGYHGTSMRMLADRARLSVPGIYHHYRDKQELLVQILTLTMSELHWRVSAAQQEAPDPLTEIANIVEALALFHTHHRKLAFIGASEMRSLTGDNRRLIAGERTRLQHILDDAINRATSAGFIDPINAATSGRAIATMCTSLPQWFNPDGPETPERIAANYVHYALALLRANTTEGRQT